MTGRSGVRYTNQRVEILDFLHDNVTHPTVEEVYQGVRKKLSHISKATVYQNLKFLAEKGLVQEVNIKGVSRFEPNLDPHHHIICRNCGKISDFKSLELTECSLAIGKKIKGFDVDVTTTSFYGTCKACR